MLLAFTDLFLLSSSSFSLVFQLFFVVKWLDYEIGSSELCLMRLLFIWGSDLRNNLYSFFPWHTGYVYGLNSFLLSFGNIYVNVVCFEWDYW